MRFVTRLLAFVVVILAAFWFSVRNGNELVNVVLPFSRALGNLTRDAGLATAALALYRVWPPLQENAVTQEAGRLLGGGPELRRSARRQQGLIRVYRRRLAGETR